jgi:hypothetical protein
MILATLIRDLSKGYTDAKNRCDDQVKLDHAKRIAELAVARVRIRPPGVVVARGGQLQQGTKPLPAVADDDLVTFN